MRYSLNIVILLCLLQFRFSGASAACLIPSDHILNLYHGTVTVPVSGALTVHKGNRAEQGPDEYSNEPAKRYYPVAPVRKAEYHPVVTGDRKKVPAPHTSTAKDSLVVPYLGGTWLI